jgi:hypothetical protein
MAMTAMSDKDFLFENELLTAVSPVVTKITCLTPAPAPTFDRLEIEILLELFEHGRVTVDGGFDTHRMLPAPSAQRKLLYAADVV